MISLGVILFWWLVMIVAGLAVVIGAAWVAMYVLAFLFLGALVGWLR